MMARIVRKLLEVDTLKKRHIVYGGFIVAVLFISALTLSNLSPYRASSSLQYFRAQVLSVQEVLTDQGGSQNIQARILDGRDMGKVISVTRNINFGDQRYKNLPVGSDILITKDSASSNYTFGDRWRMPGVAVLFILLLALVVLVGRWRGITGIFGLVISIVVLSMYVLPRIVDGYSPYLACLEGAFAITIISIYVAHGFSKRTTMAFVSSVLTLSIVVVLVALATYLTGTSEVINEETFSVLDATRPVSLSELLTGGIIIASLGALYDITVGQAAAVDEIYKANHKLGALELYKRGLSVGREHIAALVNTLALVYVGVALPSIVLAALYNHAPLIVAFNDETVVEEVVRTCVASMGMLAAVPITTGLAAYVLPKWYQKNLVNSK